MASTPAVAALCSKAEAARDACFREPNETVDTCCGSVMRTCLMAGRDA